MRKLVSRKKVVIGALALLFLFSLNVVSAETRGFVVSASAPFQARLWQAGSSIAAFFAGGDLQKESDALRQENLALRSEVIALQELARENAELRNLLEFGLQEKFTMVPSEIIAKNIAADTVVIRGGREQKIQEGMPVITASRVAVGKIGEVFPRHSLVQLLSEENSTVDAQIAETQTAGVVRGRGAQEIILDLVPQEESVFAGDTVVTSNLGGVFPENLLIGEMKEVVKTGAEPFQKARIEPFFSLKNAELIFVITAEKP